MSALVIWRHALSDSPQPITVFVPADVKEQIRSIAAEEEVAMSVVARRWLDAGRQLGAMPQRVIWGTAAPFHQTDLLPYFEQMQQDIGELAGLSARSLIAQE